MTKLDFLAGNQQRIRCCKILLQCAENWCDLCEKQFYWSEKKVTTNQKSHTQNEHKAYWCICCSYRRFLLHEWRSRKGVQEGTRQEALNYQSLKNIKRQQGTRREINETFTLKPL